MIKITPDIFLNETEVTFSFVTSQGPGGQNVNKVATAVLLRFNIARSSLSADVRERLLQLLGKRVTARCELIIKASRHRTQARNKQDAIERLQTLIKKVLRPPKSRKKTRPTLASKERRLTL